MTKSRGKLAYLDEGGRRLRVIAVPGVCQSVPRAPLGEARRDPTCQWLSIGDKPVAIIGATPGAGGTGCLR